MEKIKYPSILLLGINSYEYKAIVNELKNTTGITEDNFHSAKVSDISSNLCPHNITYNGFNISGVSFDALKVCYIRSSNAMGKIMRPFLFALKSHGVKVINIRDNICIPDKITQHIEMFNSGIPLPNTYIGSAEEMLKVADNLAYPVLYKNPIQHNGRGIIKLSSPTELKELLYNKTRDKPVLIQQYIKPHDSIPVDYRVIVIGGEIIGIIKRTGKRGELVTNISAGNTGYAIELDYAKYSQFKQICETISNVMHLDIYAVDLIDSPEGYKVLEINISFQFKGFEMATGVNVGKKIASYIAKIGLPQKQTPMCIFKNQLLTYTI